MTLLIISLLIILFAAGIVFLYLRKKQQTLGSLSGKKIYQDTPENPGEVLSSQSINLVGKPDYILHTKEGIIPIEVKTGKPPMSPYENHSMQLMAYCLLVEERYKTRPPGGILRYQQNNSEFKIAFTKEAEMAVRTLVDEITQKKESGEELHCKHPEHNNQ